MEGDGERARAVLAMARAEVGLARVRKELARAELADATAALVDLEREGLALVAEARRAHRHRHLSPNAQPPAGRVRCGGEPRRADVGEDGKPSSWKPPAYPPLDFVPGLSPATRDVSGPQLRQFFSLGGLRLVYSTRRSVPSSALRER